MPPRTWSRRHFFALRYFDSFRGGDGRPWLLGVVRRASFDRLAKHRAAEEPFPTTKIFTTAATNHRTRSSSPSAKSIRQMFARL